jgi:ATP synthase protein I
LSDSPGKDRADRLAELDRRISDARTAGKPKPRADKDKYAAMSLGWRLVIELVISMVIGAAMGWGLDALLGTLPLFLIVMTLFGFAAGVRTMMRSAEEMHRKNVPGAQPGTEDERG